MKLQVSWTFTTHVKVLHHTLTSDNNISLDQLPFVFRQRDKLRKARVIILSLFTRKRCISGGAFRSAWELIVCCYCLPLSLVLSVIISFFLFYLLTFPCFFFFFFISSFHSSWSTPSFASLNFLFTWISFISFLYVSDPCWLYTLYTYK